jgi:glycosyltransferase involved in cell wall biosynthesis
MIYLSVRSHIARLRREFPFDAVMAAWAYPDAAAAAMIAAEYKCPLITRVMGSDINHLGRDPQTRPYVQAALRQSQRVIAVSEALREGVIDLGIPPERVTVLHNAVNGQRFVLRDRMEARAQLELPQERPIVCYVGRFGHEKGGDVLIEAMGRVKAAERCDVLLTMVGGGKLEAAWRAQVKALGVEDQVRFCGERSHDEVSLWVSGGDVLCLPSRREGCPNVVLEALASGRPVVASRVGGVPELLSESSGVMVPAEDPEALAGALLSALNRRWDPQALRDSVEYLSWDDVGRREWQIVAEAMEEWGMRSQLQHRMGLGARQMVEEPR